MKAMVFTAPKSGTYLTAQLLQELGMKFSWMHVSDSHYEKYNPEQLDEGRRNPQKFRTITTIDRSKLKIKEGEFAVSHMYPRIYTKHELVDFKKVLVTRPHKECDESIVRWVKESGREREPWSNDARKQMLGWKKEGAFHLEFYDIINNNHKRIDDLQVYLFGEVMTNSSKAVEAALSAETLTKSSLRT